MGDNKEEKLDDSNAQNEFEKSEAGSIKEGKKKNRQHELADFIERYSRDSGTLTLYYLPKRVVRLVKALADIQLEHYHQQAEYFKELMDLEIKYESICKPLYEKRAAIVSGAYIPTDEECEFQSNSHKELQPSNELQQLVKPKEGADKETEVDDLKGIPYFWQTAFKHAPPLEKMIQVYDKPVLKHLIDVKATKSLEPMICKLEFYFEPNDYFKNTVLTKHYALTCNPDDDGVGFEGLKIVKAKGCSIDWNEGKNVTQKTVKEYNKRTKDLREYRVETKSVPRKSFFKFFDPPTITGNERLRAAIVSGAYIPTDEKCEFQSNSHKELQPSNEFQQLVKPKEGADKETEVDDLKGIPNFWLTAFTHAPPLENLIQAYDKPVLKHLIDVKATKSLEPMIYKLEFHFEPNDYFKNAVLTKHYALTCNPDDDGVSFEGPYIVKSKGCSIDWNEGKNVTQKTVKTYYKKQKILGGFRVVAKSVPRKSFFKFFDPPTITGIESWDEEARKMADDSNFAYILIEKLVPHAVLFFTGDNIRDDYEENQRGIKYHGCMNWVIE